MASKKNRHSERFGTQKFNQTMQPKQRTAEPKFKGEMRGQQSKRNGMDGMEKREEALRNGALQGFPSAREKFNNALTGEGRIGKMQGFRSRRITVWRLAVGSTGRKAKETAGLPHAAGICSWASARPSWLSGLADSALGTA